MTEFEDGVLSAGAALSALADGPGREAADALAGAFAQAGASIEQVLGRAARSGELDFSRMAESILRDLARVAAEAILTQDRLSAARGGGQALNLNFALGAGADASGILSNRGAIAAAVARAAVSGGRFL